MNVTLIIIAILILIISHSFKINFYFKYNLLTNIGTIKVKLFKFLTVFNSNITLVGEYLNFTREKENVIPLKIQLNNTNIIYFQKLLSRLSKKIYGTDLNTFVEFALENAQASALISAIINILVSCYFFNVRNENKDIKLTKNINTGFRHNVIELQIQYNFIITFYDIIWTVINTFIIVRREKRNEKRKANFERQHNNS